MEASGVEKPARRHDLDWLRVLATLGIFFMHSLRMFDPMDWEVKNNLLNDNIMIIMLLLVQFLMPMFFLVSGASIYLSMTFRTPRQFLKSRVVRILVPYLFIGLFVLVPPQMYIDLASHGRLPPGRTFVDLYPEYLKSISLFHGDFPFVALPMYHLWYLVYLFIFSLALLPLFMYLKTGPGRSLVSRLAAFFERTGAVFLFALPFALLTILLDPASPAGNMTWFGGWSLLVYLFFLFYGYLLFADERFEQAIERQAKAALVFAVLTYPVVLYGTVQFLTGEGFLFGTAGYAGVMLLRALNSWCFIVGFLGLGKTYLSFNNRVLGYASEGSLPFYMLHQTVILIIGFFIMDWQLGIFPKWVILATASFAAIMAVYEFAIRRFNVSRILFGLKPIKGR